ncbi:head maturation protease, ClpP-related [Ligilactobacillus agilis]|uniref:head maturation protease, ClpP-related n=1 Tax=Ligilactobacillus agilis TaxID=1601 RepID=UPI00255C87B0|nr:head maturation protease, ClpP-related [Ligilactobacillus agilis]
MKRFWNWGSENNTPTLTINGTIAPDSWIDDEVSPQVFQDELSQGPIDVWLNSPGGDCVAASQIYTMLMSYPNDVNVKIAGIAASAASVIAMAGTKVSMAPTALMMIHNPLSIAAGNRSDMAKAIQQLDETKESIINAYEIKTGLPRGKIAALMDKQTWMNPNKAIELGFADEVLNSETVYDSYIYSERQVNLQILNKLQTKNHYLIESLQRRLFLLPH